MVRDGEDPALPEQLTADEEAAMECEAEAFVEAQWKAADEYLAAEWPHATDSERAIARSIWTELARRQEDARGVHQFVAAACRDAQDMASRYGWALHAISQGAGDRTTARQALLGKPDAAPFKHCADCTTRSPCERQRVCIDGVREDGKC